MNKTQFSELVAFLSQVIGNHNSDLEIIFNSYKCNVLDIAKFEEILTKTKNITQIVNQLQNLKSLVLIDQDYANFCMLVFYGSLMAEFLRKTKRIAKWVRKHARNWQDLELKFRSLLEKDSFLAGL